MKEQWLPMRRLFSPPIWIAAAVLGGLGMMSASSAAGPSPAAGQSSGQQSPSKATKREPRPQGRTYHVEAVSPELERVLKQWYLKTKDIKKLHGTHTRYEFGRAFMTATVARGDFFYEAPDKGRIDIKPVPVEDADPEQEGDQVQDMRDAVYDYKSCRNITWICDGNSVIQVNHDAETYTTKSLAPSEKGQHIMDGPLPFLFGMPPKKAKKRYQIELQEKWSNETQVCLHVLPRTRKDASVWEEAFVMLDRETFLPSAVKLARQNGNRSTVYQFDGYEVNGFSIIQLLGGSPFAPPGGYAQIQNQNPGPAQPLRINGQPITGVPSVVGLEYKEAKGVLVKRGYTKVQIIPTAKPCGDPKLLHRVKSQSPRAGARVNPKQPIQITLYASQKDIAYYKSESRKKLMQKKNQLIQKNRQGTIEQTAAKQTGTIH